MKPGVVNFPRQNVSIEYKKLAGKLIGENEKRKLFGKKRKRK
jgi:hypothetical protein